jgi:hypothetical protein
MAFYRKAAFAIAIVSFALAAQDQAADKQQEAGFAAKAKTMRVLGTWQGTTPCADCSGIITTLTLYTKAPNDFIDAIYRLNLKYIDRGSFSNYGEWTVLRGMPGNRHIAEDGPGEPCFRQLRETWRHSQNCDGKRRRPSRYLYVSGWKQCEEWAFLRNQCSDTPGK